MESEQESGEQSILAGSEQQPIQEHGNDEAGNSEDKPGAKRHSDSGDDAAAGATIETPLRMEHAKAVTLKREVTPFSGVLVVVNQFIGSGIFITQSGILNHAGSFGLSLLCWVFGGAVALCGAMCYLELGLLVRKTGGEYAILLEAYSFRKKNRWVEMLGSLVAFLYTWTNVFLLRGVAVSVITLTCARYFTRPFFIGCDVPEAPVKLLALTILCRSLN